MPSEPATHLEGRLVSEMKIRVVGPDVPGPSTADLRRIFKGLRLTASRRERLLNSGRVVAYCGGRVVGLAAYARFESELQVHEFGVDHQAPCGTEAVVGALLDALEVACLAGGGCRLVILSDTAIDEPFLTARGFRAIGGGDHPHRFIKPFSA